jgi:hypothetical protein
MPNSLITGLVVSVAVGRPARKYAQLARVLGIPSRFKYGVTKTQLAERYRVSEKTISNDLHALSLLDSRSRIPRSVGERRSGSYSGMRTNGWIFLPERERFTCARTAGCYGTSSCTAAKRVARLL